MSETFTIVLDRELAPGPAANAAAALGMSAGKRRPDWVGPDLADASGSVHPGLTGVPVPVLAADADALPGLRERALAAGLWVVGFTETARRARAYDEYGAALAAAGSGSLRYLGIGLAGDREAVKKLTSSLPLFR